MPRFTVKMRNVTIGWAALEALDAGMGAAKGAFRPGPGYELVQPVFQLFTDGQGDGSEESVDHAMLRRYHAARDRLGLSLHGPDGALIPTEFIDIVDLTAEHGAAGLELQVAVTSSRAWRALERGASGAHDT